MRDLILSITAVMLLGGGFSVGRHYLATQEYEQNIRVADAPPDPILVKQYLAEVSKRPHALLDLDTVLVSKPTTLDLSPKAVVQPALNAEGESRIEKPEVQPALSDPRFVVQVPSAKPEKKMVGPDGVVFLRAGSSSLTTAVAKLGKPVVPQRMGGMEYEKALETLIVVKAPALPQPEPLQETPTIVASNLPVPSPAAKPILAKKTSSIMVGPDGVVYQPVSATRSIQPR